MSSVGAAGRALLRAALGDKRQPSHWRAPSMFCGGPASTPPELGPLSVEDYVGIHFCLKEIDKTNCDF